MILVMQEVTMFPSQDRLTLDALLSDPLTQLVMRSDHLTPADVAQAFEQARCGLARARGAGSASRRAACAEERGLRWLGF